VYVRVDSLQGGYRPRPGEIGDTSLVFVYITIVLRFFVGHRKLVQELGVNCSSRTSRQAAEMFFFCGRLHEGYVGPGRTPPLPSGRW